MVTSRPSGSAPERSKGFTMIELIYAIVIMGLVFITLPMILLNNNRSVEQNLLQETILIATTKLNSILSYQWDETSRDANTSISLAKTEVVDTTSAVAALQRVASDFRVGHFQQPLHRRMTPNVDAATRMASTALGADTGDLDDIDDFIVTNDAVITHTAGTAVDYKYDYNMDVTVSYADDNAFRGGTSYASSAIQFSFDTAAYTASTTSLKKVDLLVKADTNNDGTDEEIIRLRAFSANIGETDFYKRTY